MTQVAYQQGTFETKDSLRLYTQTWTCSEPQAHLVLVHGLAEHSDRYRPIIEFLTQQKVCVYTFDLRGHGKSEGEPAFVNSFDDYVSDLKQFINRVTTQFQSVQFQSVQFQPTQSQSAQLEELGFEQATPPLFLLGHSMGGAIATRFVLTQAQTVEKIALQGLILSAPALALREDIPPFLRWVSGWLGRYLPKLPTLPLDGQGISRDSDVVQAYLTDPLVYHGRLRARLGAELVRVTAEIQAQMSAIQLPLLLMHGTGDRIVPVVASQMLYERATSPDKTLKQYDELYHEIFNEPERQQVWTDLIAWLQPRSGESAAGEQL